MSYLAPVEITHLLIEQIPLSDPLRRLWDDGDVGLPEIAAAMRWRKDWLAHEEGYFEGYGGSGAGDAHSYQLARAAAGARLDKVRAGGIQLCGQVRLKLILIDGRSYSAAGRVLRPNSPRQTASVEVKAAFLLLLLQLAELYAAIDGKRKGSVHRHPQERT